MSNSLYGVGQAFSRADETAAESLKLRTEAESYKLATDGSRDWLAVLKYALFILFCFYNYRLFAVTVPGWEGKVTAVFALAGEATALYCLHNYTRSAGAHKAALAGFGGILMLFSACHATVSFFRLESATGLSAPLQFYCERIAFPLLFGLLTAAAVVIPLCHWRKKVAQEQAAQQVTIATGRARLVGEAAKMRNESLLETERLNQLRERIKLGNQYVAELEQFAAMKQREHEALSRITNPEVRREISNALGLKIPDTPVAAQQHKTTVQWRGGKQISNGLDSWQDDQLPKV